MPQFFMRSSSSTVHVLPPDVALLPDECVLTVDPLERLLLIDADAVLRVAACWKYDKTLESDTEIRSHNYLTNTGTF